MEKYLSIGTNNLDKMYFEPIKNFGTFKPICGLWATKQDINNLNYNEWLEYLINKNRATFSIKYSRYNYNIPAVLFSLKKDSKIYYVKTINDLQVLMQRFPILNEFRMRPYKKLQSSNCIDYEKLSIFFDGIYFDITSLEKQCNRNETLKQIIDNLSVNTLILFNLNCILYYQPVSINVTPFLSKESISYQIIIDDNKKFVSESRYDFQISLTRHK